MYRKLYFIGIGAYFIILVFSILFYKERTILNDVAFHLFYILKDSSFSIQSFRFGDAFPQFLPVLACKAGMSLNSILISYSSGFILFYFTCYFISGTICKQYEFALSILLFHILFTSETFYYIPSALIEGTTFLLVVFAFITMKLKNRLDWLSTFIIIAATVFLTFFHPLLIFIIIYCLLFFALQKEPKIEQKILIRIGIIFFITLILKTIFLRVPYETHALGGLKNFVTAFPDYFSLYSHKRFFQKCATEYYWIPLTFNGISIYYYSIKDWKKLLLFIGFFIGYYFLVNISYPAKSTPVFYIENLYMPLAFFLTLPIIFDILPALNTRKLAMPLYILILLTGCIRLYTTHYTYTARLDWERRFLKEHPNKKMIYPTRKVPMDTLQMTWGTPYEFWLLSTIEQYKTASIIIDDNPDRRQWAFYITKSMVVNHNVVPYNQLNPKYFHFTDTTSGYEIIK